MNDGSTGPVSEPCMHSYEKLRVCRFWRNGLQGRCARSIAQREFFRMMCVARGLFWATGPQFTFSTYDLPPPPTGRAAAATGSEQRRAASREIAGIFASAQYGVCHRQRRRLVKCVRVRWWVRRANHRAKPAIRIGTPTTRRFDGWLFSHHVFMLTKDTAVYCY